MTRQLQLSNNASSRLAANITAAATSLSVTPGDGAEFPSLSAGQFFMATLVKSDGTTEVVKVTARTTDTFTIVRAAEAVAGVTTAYAFSAGDKVEARLTAGSLGTELSRLDAAAYISAANKSANYTVVEADISSLIRMDTSGGSRTVTLPSIASLTQDFDTIISKVTSDANTLTIARSSSDTINGATSYVLYSQFQSAWLVADRANNTWTVITSANTGSNVIVDPFTGDGIASAFTLSGDPIAKNNTAVFVGGVYQNKATYTLSGTTLTLGGIPANGVKVEVVWTQPLVIGVPSDGSVTTAKLADNALDATVAGLAKMADGFLQATTAGLAKMADGFLAATTAGRAKMADLFVTTAKLADACVTTVKITDSNVTTAKIADANITAAKLSGAQSGSAPIYGARAWVNFNGTGTVAIRASGNVSSITDNGVGDYTVNFTTAMPDTNYSASGFASGGGATYQIFGGSQSGGYISNTGSLRAQFGFVSSVGGVLTNQDPPTACVQIFR